MIRKILVYEDAFADDHPALDRALQLARNKKMKLKIVDVVDMPSDTHGELHRPMRTLVEQERKDRLRALCDPLQHQDSARKAGWLRVLAPDFIGNCNNSGYFSNQRDDGRENNGKTWC
jgi:hypothetical protein